jgi:vacuolar-type H+-ATPase subunit I/STV1
MRLNPIQIGFSIITGWIIVFFGNVIQSIINPRGLEMFWVVLFLGLSLIGFGFITKERMISTYWAKTLLQIGVVVTIIWVMLLVQAEGPYDLGLPKPYVTTGYTPDGIPTVTPLSIILFLASPVLGLILLILGILLKIRNRVKF